MTHAEYTTLRPRVYLAGPITKGSRNHNLYMFNGMHELLMRHGFAPFNPGPTMQLPFAWDGQFDHADWLECCYPWVAAANAVLRLRGESEGADAEVRFAKSRAIPVFEDFDALTNWRDNEYLREQRRDDNGKTSRWTVRASRRIADAIKSLRADIAHEERATSPADPRAGM